MMSSENNSWNKKVGFSIMWVFVRSHYIGVKVEVIACISTSSSWILWLQMLDVLESFVQKRDYSYIRMDGATGIASRQPLVARFNTVSLLSLFIRCMFTVVYICYCWTDFLTFQ